MIVQIDLLLLYVVLLDSLYFFQGDNGDIFIAVGTAYVGVKKIRKNFQTKRRLLVSEALVNAKKDFIEFVRTDMSAKDIIIQPETPFTTEFDELVENTEMQVMDAFDNYVAALAKVDSAKAIHHWESTKYKEGEIWKHNLLNHEN